jgi:hypothetical protein
MRYVQYSMTGSLINDQMSRMTTVESHYLPPHTAVFTLVRCGKIVTSTLVHAFSQGRVHINEILMTVRQQMMGKNPNAPLP